MQRHTAVWIIKHANIYTHKHVKSANLNSPTEKTLRVYTHIHTVIDIPSLLLLRMHLTFGSLMRRWQSLSGKTNTIKSNEQNNV